MAREATAISILSYWSFQRRTSADKGSVSVNPIEGLAGLATLAHDEEQARIWYQP